VAVVDHDQSALSLRLRDALQPPLFKRPVELPAREVSKAMDEGRFIFVLDIPPGFEADVLRGRHPQIQLLVDATAMTQASIGASYIQQITDRESSTFLGQPDLEQAASARVVVRIAFNPNHYEVWFLSITQIILYLTILSIVLVGAAFMRERERGTRPQRRRVRRARRYRGCNARFQLRRHGKRKLKANRVASQHRPRPTFAHYHRRRRLRRRSCAARKHHSRKRPNHPGKQLSKNPPPLHGKQS